MNIDGWLLLQYTHEITAQTPTCQAGGQLTIKAKGNVDIYVAKGDFSVDYSLTATPNGKPNNACKFSLGTPVFRPYWDWDVGRGSINVTVGAVAGTTNFNIDGAWTGELKSRFVWYRPWTALDWGVSSKIKFSPFATFDMWSCHCCACYTVTASGQKASYSMEVIPGRIALAAVALAKAPAFARGIGRTIESVVDDIVEHLPWLLPATQ